jgi:hypothetical protein
MRRLCATGLTVLLCVHPLYAEGPLTRSAAREASRLAAEPAGGVDRSSWKAVRLLDPGAKIVITTEGGTLLRTFKAVDDTVLTVGNGRADEQIPVDDVLMIEKQMHRGNVAAAVLGTLGGVFLGTAVAVHLAFAQCYACGAVELVAWSAFLGIPIATGYGAWRATSHLTEEVIYRRTPTLP